MKTCGIYKITSPTGRIYVGQSVHIENRFSSYKCTNAKSQPILNRSFNKHGIINHKFEIVEECEMEILNIRERYWQDYYDVLNGGLNCKLSTNADRSGCVREETRIKMSIAAKLKTITPEHKANISKSLKDRKLSETAIKNIGTSTILRLSKKVINTETGIVYPSAKICAENNGLKYSWFKQVLNGSIKTNPTNFKYL